MSSLTLFFCKSCFRKYQNSVSKIVYLFRTARRKSAWDIRFRSLRRRRVSCPRLKTYCKAKSSRTEGQRMLFRAFSHIVWIQSINSQAINITNTSRCIVVRVVGHSRHTFFPFTENILFTSTLFPVQVEWALGLWIMIFHALAEAWGIFYKHWIFVKLLSKSIRGKHFPRESVMISHCEWEASKMGMLIKLNKVHWKKFAFLGFSASPTLCQQFIVTCHNNHLLQSFPRHHQVMKAIAANIRRTFE